MTTFAALGTYEQPKRSYYGGLRRFFSLRRSPILDPRDLSDHLKRDLGLLDGKEPSGSIK